MFEDTNLKTPERKSEAIIKKGRQLGTLNFISTQRDNFYMKIVELTTKMMT
jgi:hypothetical protein